MGLADWLSFRAVLGSSLRARLLNDPFYRFQSVEELQLAASLGLAIDVNRAGVDDWLRLPGISIHQARSLVALAQAGVQFHCLEDLAAALSVPVQRLAPLQPILSFCYYDPNGLDTIQPVNPNRASVDALIRLPSVDLYLARAIVHNRQQQGPYRNIADLQARLALPPQVTAVLMHYLCF